MNIRCASRLGIGNGGTAFRITIRFWGVVELFEVFLGSLDKEARFPSEKVWEELWDSVELLSQRVKALSKQIDELATTRDASQESESSGGLAVLLGAVLFGTGLALGRWWG